VWDMPWQGLNRLRKKSVLPVNRGPQRLKAVPFKDSGFSAACLAQSLAVCDRLKSCPDTKQTQRRKAVSNRGHPRICRTMLNTALTAIPNKPLSPATAATAYAVLASIPAMHVSNSSGSGYYLIGVFMLGGMSSDEDCDARGGRSFPHATVKCRQRHAFL
jgi:hypothetical protein